MRKNNSKMTDYLNTMLISPNKVKAYGVLNLNVDDSVVGTAIRTSQNVYLVDIIGIDLVQRLQELVYNKIRNIEGDKIDDDDMIAYKTLLDDYVEPVLVYRTAVEVARIQSLKIRNMGVIKNSDTNVNAGTLADIEYIGQYNETLFYDFVNKMVGYLCENKKAIKESVIDCSCASRPLYARTNLWLGK